ncbi:glycine zipper 2TM domain-containing protein [Pandoraea pnomenusa]|uniref:glycine zipper 2TM domain-containing protein n=1 Tax=Pandoraea pnomenusa TaxID=93220 RepID=UPI003340DFF8
MKAAKSILVVITALAMGSSIFGCTLGGAAAGGVIGHEATGGSTAGTIGGAVVGGVIGHELGK